MRGVILVVTPWREEGQGLSPGEGMAKVVCVDVRPQNHRLKGGVQFLLFNLLTGGVFHFSKIIYVR